MFRDSPGSIEAKITLFYPRSPSSASAHLFYLSQVVTARARFINDMGHLARHCHADGRRNDALQKDLG